MDFGPGSKGMPWQPAPGFTYAGDAWCYGCQDWRPAEKDQQGRARISAHEARGALCPGTNRPVTTHGSEHQE
jgi:hypothetical protein